ncbi:MAG TPA: hypothetical protein VEK15_17505 [Vicinamibacteria bacterium]|nr:hypothetical protein [Vicinamibacteria bacterium]
MTKAAIRFTGFLLSGLALAASSPSFVLDEHAFNSGGLPDGGPIPSSGVGFRVTLVSIGGGLAHLDLASASFALDSSFSTAYPPPSDVLGVEFTSGTDLAWDPQRSMVYNVYRDLISNLIGLGFGSCLAPAERALPIAADSSVPAVGDGYFYLVTAENRLDEEGTKGFQAMGGIPGAERANAAPCP